MDPPLKEAPDLSTFENKIGLAEDLKFLASMPEMCDVTFLVGKNKEPICAVRAILAARSRVFYTNLFEKNQFEMEIRYTPWEGHKRHSEPNLHSTHREKLLPQQHYVFTIDNFEADVFRQVIEYIHTGSVTLQPRTLLGVMTAAGCYGLNELKELCANFTENCITLDTVCPLLGSVEFYSKYKKSANFLLKKILDFVDKNATEVLHLGTFVLIPQPYVELILKRKTLKTDEFTKFQAALLWSKNFCENHDDFSMQEIMETFLVHIQFYKIPPAVLMGDVYPLGIVAHEVIMNALAYQADPSSIDLEDLKLEEESHSSRPPTGHSASAHSSFDESGKEGVSINTDVGVKRGSTKSKKKDVVSSSSSFESGDTSSSDRAQSY